MVGLETGCLIQEYCNTSSFGLLGNKCFHWISFILALQVCIFSAFLFVSGDMVLSSRPCESWCRCRDALVWQTTRCRPDQF